MTREQYIKFRNNNNIYSIIYMFYVQTCISKGIKPLQANNFFYYFNLWAVCEGLNTLVIETLINYLDNKFSVILIMKEDKIIKII
jgi:hypothetical protein